MDFRHRFLLRIIKINEFLIKKIVKYSRTLRTQLFVNDSESSKLMLQEKVMKRNVVLNDPIDI